MPENNNNNQPLDFAEKVLQTLKRTSRAVDLNEPIASSVNRDFTAYGAQESGDPGPGSGGNKDIVIIPGFGGAAASSTSQVNFYWNAPAVPDSTGIDSNVRATIYNYAITQTRPTLVIGGYDGTNQYKPIANYGTGTGITAKIWFHPFLGRIDADQFGFNTLAATGVSTATGILTWDTTQNKIRVGVAGIAKTLAYTDDISPFSGSATTASNLNIATSATQTSNHFLTMSASQTATGIAGAAISTVSTVFVVPNTGVVNATGFSGNVTGTVSGNVTGTVSGNLTGNVTGIASTANSVAQILTSQAGDHFVNFSPSGVTAVGAGVSVATAFKFIPSTGVVTATGFSGNVTGTVSGNVTGSVSGSVTGGVSGNVTGNVTGTVSGNLTGNLTGNVSGNVTGNLTGTVSGNVTGIASTANSVAQILTSQAGDHFLTFSPSGVTAVGTGISVATALKFIPSTGVVTATGFSGNVTGTVSGNVTGSVSGSVTGGVSGNVTGNVTGTVSGNITGGVSGNVTGNLTGNVSGNVTGNLTGNVSGIASTANSVAQILTAQAGDHFLTFSPSGVTAVGIGVSVATALKFIPSTGVVTATGFSGNVTGTVSGNVTGSVSGSVTGGVSGNVTGNVTGTVSGNLTGNLTGNVSGNVTGNLTGNVSGNVTGIASTANSVAQILTAQAGDHFVNFSPSGVTAVGAGVSVATAFKFIPSTGVVTATGFSGNVTGTVSGNVTGSVSGSVTGGVSGNVTGNVTGTVSGNITGTVSGNVTGSVSGNLTGNVSGNVTGNLTGNVSGNVVGFATTAQNVNVLAADAATGNHFLPFVRTQTGSGLALSTDNTLYYDPAGNILYSTNFSGAFTGTISGIATTAANMVVNNAAESTTHYILMSPSATGAGVAVSSDTTFTINPSTNALSMGSGNITANNVTLGSAARTVSTSTGNLILDSSGGQVDITDNVVITGNLTVQGTTITVDSTVSTIVDPVIVVGSGVGGSHSTADNNMDRGIEFRWSTGAGNATTGFFGFSDTDGKFRFIPNATTVAGSNVYTGTVGTIVSNIEGTVSGNVTGNVSGNLTGNVSGSVTGGVSGNVTGNVTGIASTANSVAQILTALAGDHFVTFSPSGVTAVGAGVSVATAFKFVPSTGVVTATGFSGNVTGTVSGNVTGSVSGSVTGGVSGNVTGNVTGTVSGNITGTVSGNLTGNVSGNVTGNLTGNVSGNVTGIASTANSVAQILTAQAGDHFLTFSPSGVTAVGTGISVATALKFIPSTGVVTATGFSGNVTGTVSGNVTGSVSGSVTGGVSGNITGNVTGTVSGNITGNVSGNVTGNLTGTVSGNVTGIASTANSVAQTLTAQAGDHFITFSPSGVTAVGIGVSVATAFKFIPSTGVVTATGFSGNVTGTVSGNVTGSVSGSVTGGVSGNVTGNVTGTVSGNLTGNLTGNVSGNVTGNLTGNVSGNVTGIASTANSVAQILTAQAGDHFITFSPSGVTAVGTGVSVATAFKFIPSTGVVTATGFSGNVTGTVSGNVTGSVSGSVTGGVSGNVTGNVTGTVSGNITGTVSGNLTGNLTGNVSGNVTGNLTGTVSGNVTGIASTANSVAQILTAQAGDHFIIFSPSGVTAVGTGVSVATAFKFIPSTGVVTATGFSGNVTGTVSGNVTGSVSGSVTGGVSGNVTGNVTGTVSGNITGTVSGNVTGNLTGNVSGNVTGNLTGSVSGTATTAQNLNVGSTAAATNYVLLSSSATGTGIAVSTKTSLAYNASTDTLTVNNIVGSGSGLTITSTTALTNNSYLTIQTNSGDDNATSDFFIRGINSTATSKFSVDANGNLRATTKSFDIPHPTKEGKRLVYGVLEGPEHGVYHRGTVEGKGNILVELPEYWTKLVNEEYSIHLTPWGNYGAQILEKAPSSFIISATGNPFTKKFKSIKVDYIVHGSRKDAHLDIEQD